MPPKRRRRFQGLYYHSSPPKVLPMNGQLPNDSARRRRGSDDFSVKLSTIRIWMHEKDIGKLTRILWAGQGNRLRQQASTNPKVKRFLSTVPYVMNSIKDVHQAVIENNLENLQANLEPPVPPALVTCRDANGLNLIHKAAGLGHATILEYLIATWPDGVNECDITGKTPLHWAASAKNNMRCYTLLTQAGCDEEAVDYKMKTPSFYRHKPNEIERAFLTYVPEAPRVSPDISTDWDALSDDNGSGKKLDIRIPEMNGFGRHSNTESNENTSEAEMTEGVSAADDEDAGGGDDEALTKEPEKEEAAEQEANEEEKAEEAQEDAPAADEEDAKADDEEVGAEDDEAEEAQEAEQDATENKEDEPQDEKQTQSVNESNAIMDEPKENEETEAQAETEVEPETDITTNEAAEETNSADNGEENHDKTNENESKDNDTNKEEGTQENEESNKEENEKGVSETNNEEVNNENTTADSEVKESTEEAASEEPKQNGEQLEDNHETKEQTNDKEENETESTEDNESNKEVDNVVESKDFEEKESHKENLLNEENSKQSENEAATTNGEGKQDDDENENINNNGEESKVISEQNKEDNTETNETGKDNEELNNEEQKNEELNNEELNNEELNNKELNNKEQSNEELNNEDDHEAGKEEDKSKGGEEEKNNHEGDEYENEQFEDENVNEPEKEEENQTKEVPDEPNDIENETKGDATESNNIVIEANGVETKTNDIENKAFDEAKPNEVPEDSSSHDKDNSTEDENNNNTNDESLQNGTEEAETQQLENSSSHIEKKDNSEPSNEEDSQETEQSLLQDIREGLTQKFDEISENLNDNIQELSNKITNIFTSSDDKGKTDETESGDVVLGSASPKSKDHPKVNGIRSGSRKSAKNVGGGTESSDDLADDEDEEPEVATVVDETSQEEEKEVEKVEDQADEVDAKEVEAKELDAKEVDANEADGDGGDPEEDAEGDADSPTSSLAIEGFVHGDAEDNTESRIDKIIASGDMEKLAQIVLNGDGQKLLDVNATEPEIQAFLRNVPNYMDKIRRVHEASRNGSLLNLQQALDRRKFAIAKDEISPNGATPLHVAVLFGHSDIVRYLAARFPETTTTTDVDGRTALHYAAVIKDNGHFYNVLLQLGANPKAPDKMGKTPEQYLADDGLKENLNYGLLLKNFGAEDLESQLLNDQVPDDLHSSRRLLQDGDVQRTLDRCFSVIQESSKAWSGTTASALAQKKPLAGTSSLQLAVTSYLSRFLKPSVYEKIKRRQTRLDHSLFDVLWPALRKTSKDRHLEEDINSGLIAPDFDVYVVFQEFLVPLIKDMHCMSVTADFKPHPRIAYFPMENAERLNTAYFVFDDDSNLVVRCLVECSRNLDSFELPLNLTIGQIEQAERLMMAKIFTAAFIEAIEEDEPGSYYTLTEVLEDKSEVYDMLNEYGLLIPLLDQNDPVQQAESTAFNGSLWPYGRGVYVSASNSMALWLNCQEHMRILSTSNSKEAADIGIAYTRVGRAITFLEQQLHFKESYLLGYLQSRPSFLGTGLKMTTIIRLPNLMKEMDNLRHLCSVRGLVLSTNGQSRLSVRLINMQSMGSVEHVLFQDYCTAVTNILSLEKDMSLTNSKHIASMLVKIFRRKKNSLAERH
uniref:Uncharacterized protein n=1 Tax=Stomoxys calcitrans TaxID=35570 RepID=A0A1I8P3T3_STOCA